MLQIYCMRMMTVVRRFGGKCRTSKRDEPTHACMLLWRSCCCCDRLQCCLCRLSSGEVLLVKADGDGSSAKSKIAGRDRNNAVNNARSGMSLRQ